MEKITMSVYKIDQDRLKPYFAPGDSWADALSKALDDIYGVPQKGESNDGSRLV